VTLRSPLGRVLGRGAAGHGVQDWWQQRVTSVALAALGVWFLAALLGLPAFDHATIVRWIAGGWTPVLLALLVLTAARHSQLGLRVVVEDYVHADGVKTAALLVLTFVHVLLAAAGVFAILELALGTAP
jgi:succinate dehydrogenase / fumarate reductase, membrane anchor subunit